MTDWQSLIDWISENPNWWPVLAGVIFTLGVLFTLWLRQRFSRLLGRRRSRRGHRAERKAAKMLKKLGFDIIETEPRFTHQLLVNGECQAFEITPDFLVHRDGQDYVVEVKRKFENLGIGRAAIRRQVLEYLIASGLPCLLIRMPQGTVDLVETNSD